MQNDQSAKQRLPGFLRRVLNGRPGEYLHLPEHWQELAKQRVPEFLQQKLFNKKPGEELQIPEHWQQHTQKLQIGKQRALLGYDSGAECPLLHIKSAVHVVQGHLLQGAADLDSMHVICSHKAQSLLCKLQEYSTLHSHTPSHGPQATCIML